MQNSTTDPLLGVVVLRGIPQEHKRQATELYYEAFHRKLTPIFGASQQASKILGVSMNASNAFVAVRGKELLGLVGFHHAGCPMLDVHFRTVVESFGLLGAIWRSLLGMLLTHRPRPGELCVECVAVSANARGQGIGSCLLNEVLAFAAKEGYLTIQLDVVDTNPRAYKLYERLGFTPKTAISLPFMKRFGFTAVTTMTLDARKL